MSEEVSRTRESYDAFAATYTERIFCDLGCGLATWLVISTSAASGCWASISRPG